jgi:hypothetical protein
MKKALQAFALLAVLVTPLFGAQAQSQGFGPPAFGQLYYDDTVVNTVVPPASFPNEGRDNLYAVPDGAAGQLPVIGVAPGDRDYHGGQWAFHLVEWNVPPYHLTSEDDVFAASGAGDVTIIRLPENDFLCPVQPN